MLKPKNWKKIFFGRKFTEQFRKPTGESSAYLRNLSMQRASSKLKCAKFKTDNLWKFANIFSKKCVFFHDFLELQHGDSFFLLQPRW